MQKIFRQTSIAVFLASLVFCLLGPFTHATSEPAYNPEILAVRELSWLLPQLW